MKRYGNKRINSTLAKYKDLRIEQPLYLDAYNQTIRTDGIAACIRTGIDFRNMDFLIEPTGPNVMVLNPSVGGAARCIMANYYKMSLSNFLHTDGHSASGVIEMTINKNN